MKKWRENGNEYWKSENESIRINSSIHFTHFSFFPFDFNNRIYREQSLFFTWFRSYFFSIHKLGEWKAHEQNEQLTYIPWFNPQHFSIFIFLSLSQSLLFFFVFLVDMFVHCAAGCWRKRVNWMQWFGANLTFTSLTLLRYLLFSH